LYDGPAHDPSPFVPHSGRFGQAFSLITSLIETRYGLPVDVDDVPAPFTGDLDGERILVDDELSSEDALFIVAHLFGHTVQWNTNPAEREIGTLAVQNPSDELLQRLGDYERRAAAYALQLFHEAGVLDLDQWFSDYSTCDVTYLLDFYRTGEKKPFRSLWKHGTTPIAPAAIPPFQPTRWVARNGVVI
jgi:hypothetical protein